jgi:hypothetical protein
MPGPRQMSTALLGDSIQYEDKNPIHVHDSTAKLNVNASTKLRVDRSPRKHNDSLLESRLLMLDHGNGSGGRTTEKGAGPMSSVLLTKSVQMPVSGSGRLAGTSLPAAISPKKSPTRM